jgi:hypothetical protein
MILCLVDGRQCGRHVTFSKTENVRASALALAALREIACVSVALKATTRLQRANSRCRAEVRDCLLIPVAYTRVYGYSENRVVQQHPQHAKPNRRDTEPAGDGADGIW